MRVAEEIRHVLSGIFERGDFRNPELAERGSPSPRSASALTQAATAFFSRLGRPDAELWCCADAGGPLSAWSGR